MRGFDYAVVTRNLKSANRLGERTRPKFSQHFDVDSVGFIRKCGLLNLGQLQRESELVREFGLTLRG
jgi:hypothetical protein